MDVLKAIIESWGWTGVLPVEFVGDNDFGNIIFKDHKGCYWRICPEELSCDMVAENKEGFKDLAKDDEFVEDWYMKVLVDKAKDKFGPLEQGRKYCLAVPGALGGAYDLDNIKTISFEELISFSSELAGKIKDLPEGSQIKINWV